MATTVKVAAVSKDMNRYKELKRMLEERDPKVQREHLAGLVATANDPVRARAFLIDSSMMSDLQRSYEVA